MDTHTLFVVEVGLTVIGTASAIAAACFEVRDRAQTEEGRRRTRKWYGDKWHTIHDSSLLELPEKVINSLVGTKQTIAKHASQIAEWFFTSWHILLYGGWVALSEAVIPNNPSEGSVSPLVSWLMFGLFGLSMLVSAIGEVTERRYWLIVALALLTLFSLLYVAGAVLDLLELSIILSALKMLFVAPMCAVSVNLALFLVALRVRRMAQETAGLLSLSISASFLLTLCALAIGHAATPDAWVPQTLQMLIANVIFDGLTVLATYVILSRAIGPQRKYSIPVAVVLDVVVAALFASASLWFGLLGTEHALSVKQTLWVLIAKSPEGTGIHLGPYFWAMHTTFLPTLFYLAVIVLCGAAKLIVLPVAKVLSKGEAVDKPHHLTAGVFALVCVIFFGLAKGVNLLEETKASLPPPATAEVSVIEVV